MSRYLFGLGGKPHSAFTVVGWVDLGKPTKLNRVVLFVCHTCSSRQYEYSPFTMVILVALDLVPRPNLLATRLAFY